MLQFIKNWTLPLAMLAGIIGYFCFACFDFLAPLKPFVKAQIAWLTPFLIFTQLLLTFCKVEVKDLSPRRWTYILLLIQLISCLFIAGALLVFRFDNYWKAALEGAMVCLICPTITEVRASRPPFPDRAERHGVLPLGNRLDHCNGADYPIGRRREHIHWRGIHHCGFGADYLLPPVLGRENHRRQIQRPHQRRAGIRAKEHDSRHLDGNHLPEPRHRYRTGQLRGLAKHHQQLAALEKAEKRRKEEQSITT